jgi:hypothetical protein
MAIAKPHRPDSSALAFGGPDLSITRDNPPSPHRPMARWTATARDDRPYRPGARRGQLSMTAHVVASPGRGARQRIE